MDWGLFFLLLLGFTTILMIIQRTEPKKRLIVGLVMLVALELARRFIWYRDVHTEGTLAFALAALFAFLFWALVGRYNPVRSSDETIKVYGLDD